MKNIISKYINIEKPKSLRESTWCGVPNTIYRYHGDWSDPEVEYKGKLYNEWDLQEYIGEIFNDYCEENNIDIKNDWAEKFGDWLSKNPDYAYTAFEELEPSDTVDNTKFESNLNEEDSNTDFQVYMNTWKNYNEYGADLEAYGIKDGWMSIDDAIDFCNKYAEDEPFINDVDNNTGLDIEVSEYDNAPTKLKEIKEQLEEYENCDDKEVVKAILEAGSVTDLSEAIDIANSGDYIWFEGVSTDAELAQAYIDMVGGIVEAVGADRLDSYFDEESWKRDSEDDFRNMIASNEDRDVDDITDEEVDEFADSVLQDEIATAKYDHNNDFFESYFDYDAFGRDIGYDYTFVTDGAICVL